MKTKDAVDHLTKQLKRDKAFRESWSASIALAFKNAYSRNVGSSRRPITYPKLHTIANEAAEHFLKTLCDEIKVPEGR